MEQLCLAVTTQSSRSGKFRRFLGRLLLVALAILIALMLDVSPTVPPAKPPTAEQARRARDFARMARSSLSDTGGVALLRADRDDVSSATTLATAVGDLGRFDGGITQGTLTLRASRRFGFIWFNGEARITSSQKGFPETRLKIGDLQLGPSVSRWLIDRARSLVRWHGINMPPLDDLVRQVHIDQSAVSALIHLPLGGAFANDLSGLRTQPIDAALAAAIYCRLATLDRKIPTSDFDAMVRRAFRPTRSALPLVEQNRAAFVALAMFTASPESGRLAGDAAQRIGTCKRATTEPTIAGRADLPKHWALSAALAVSLGDDIGTAMGEWKELSDSRPGGSGFSFVDLSADRAGLAVARRAIDPATAEDTVNRLRVATSESILPIRALALSEGLNERQFTDRYRTIESAQFASAKARIDRVIAQTIGR
jgi:hypothetical protein